MGREFASAAARWMHLLSPAARPEIVAVADPVASARDWFGAPFATADYRELLARPEVEAVYAAVPHDLHEELYLACLRAGKHLMAEKPFGIDLPAARRICDEIVEGPGLVVRCSSEFPFFPAAQRIASLFQASFFGRIIEVKASFLHSSDLDPNKPINWKRQVAHCGAYGCLGDLGLHVVHLPFRVGIVPVNVRALLSKVVEARPDGKGGLAPCETWDNATLACWARRGVDEFPMILEAKRISPGDTNSWSIGIYGTTGSAEFSTKRPKTLRTLPYVPGSRQGWVEEDLGSVSVNPTITGGIFEFGFSDAILQMWASFLAEVVGEEPGFGCATPSEALLSHELFTAALESWNSQSVVAL
jgi:predicted dehydrogenase